MCQLSVLTVQVCGLGLGLSLCYTSQAGQFLLYTLDTQVCNTSQPRVPHCSAVQLVLLAGLPLLLLELLCLALPYGRQNLSRAFTEMTGIR